MKAIIVLVLLFVGVVTSMLFYVSKMPGASPGSIGSVLTDEERSASDSMRATCEQLAHVIGHRSTAKQLNVTAAREYIVKRLGASALKSRETPFSVRGQTGTNIDAEIEGGGMKSEVVVLGAHYDTDAYVPGADDNASGCAMLLELASYLRNQSHDRTIKIVFFDFGSSRFAGGKDSGSAVWAENVAKSNTNVVAMISLDSIGRFADDPGSQGGPFPLSLMYPKQGNFLLVAGDLHAREFVKSTVTSLRTTGSFPTEGLTVPSALPWFDASDHVAFREHGWPSIVITDTGPYRNKEHGLPEDTPDRLQYDRMAKALSAIEKVVDKLARAGTSVTALN